MGFMDKLKESGAMDKLKNAGKVAVQGLNAMGATSYGIVASGKHKLCKISMNTEKDTLVFIKLTSVEAQYVIRESIKTFSLYSEYEDICKIKVVFNDGEESIIHLQVDTDTSKSLDWRYRHAADLVFSLRIHAAEVSEETRMWVRKIMKYAGYDELISQI